MCCINSGNNLHMFCAAALSRSAGCNISRLGTDHFAGAIRNVCHAANVLLPAASSGLQVPDGALGRLSPPSPATSTGPQLMGTGEGVAEPLEVRNAQLWPKPGLGAGSSSRLRSLDAGCNGSLPCCCCHPGKARALLSCQNVHSVI